MACLLSLISVSMIFVVSLGHPSLLCFISHPTFDFWYIENRGALALSAASHASFSACSCGVIGISRNALFLASTLLNPCFCKSLPVVFFRLLRHFSSPFSLVVRMESDVLTTGGSVLPGFRLVRL